MSLEMFDKKLYTDEVLKLKEEADQRFQVYFESDSEARKQIAFYTNRDPRNLYDSFIGYAWYNIDLPDEIKELIKISEQKWKDYKVINNQYQTLLYQNAAQLVYDITPENSITFLRHDGTKEVFTEFCQSFKPFLIIGTAMGIMIILNHRKLYEHQSVLKSIIMYQLNDRKRHYDTNKSFFDDVSGQMEEYKEFLLPQFGDPKMTRPVPVPLKMPYILKAQSFWEDYGRTDDYLLIGFMTRR